MMLWMMLWNDGDGGIRAIRWINGSSGFRDIGHVPLVTKSRVWVSARR